MDDPTTVRPATRSVPAVALAGAVAVAVILGVVFFGYRFLGSPGMAGSRADAPHGPAGPASCPDRFDLGSGPPQVRRSGQLVPAGADGGLLCTYDPRTSEVVLVLASSRPLHGSVDRLVTYLNNLPVQPPADARSVPGETVVHDCLLYSGRRYQIVLSYPDHTYVTVAVYDACGVVEQGGAVRYLLSMRDLLSMS